MPARKLTYKSSGVDVNANTVWVERIKHAMRSTYGPRVISRHNAFAGMFRLDFDEQILRRNYRQPVLVACADGVGSKVLLAAELGDLSTVGIDLVAMNVNDMITCGAEPLFFLDYLAVHKLEPEKLVVLMDSISEGCRMAGCALLGGETAEMPDVYAKGVFDLGAFAVGVVELPRAIEPERVMAGDRVIGLASSGIHSNGYSLVRRVIRERKLKLDAKYPELGETLAAAVMRPTRIYVDAVLGLLRRYKRKKVVSAMAHITGGGLVENISRVIPETCDVIIDRSKWTPPPIFPFLQRHGVTRREMFRVFNMGIGYVLIVRPTYVQTTCAWLKRAGETPRIIGRVMGGKGRVRLV